LPSVTHTHAPSGRTHGALGGDGRGSPSLQAPPPTSLTKKKKKHLKKKQVSKVTSNAWEGCYRVEYVIRFLRIECSTDTTQPKVTTVAGTRPQASASAPGPNTGTFLSV
jgi:hypothetical protein